MEEEIKEEEIEEDHERACTIQHRYMRDALKAIFYPVLLDLVEDYLGDWFDGDNEVIKLGAFVYSVCALSDGRLASGSYDKTIRVWSSGGACLQTLEGHTDCVTELCALSDGRLASCSYDKTIRVWSSDGACLQILEGHTECVYSVCVLSDGRLASCSYDKTIRVWS